MEKSKENIDKIESVPSLYFDMKEKQMELVKLNENMKSIQQQQPDCNDKSSCCLSLSDSKIQPQSSLIVDDNDSAESELFITRSELYADEQSESNVKMKSNIQPERQQSNELPAKQLDKAVKSESKTIINKLNEIIANLRPKSKSSSLKLSSPSIVLDDDLNNSASSQEQLKWLPVQTDEQIERNWFDWFGKHQQSACILMNDNFLNPIVNDHQSTIYYDRYHKLFTSKYHGTTFYLGRFDNSNPVLVKKIQTNRKSFDSDCNWISIVKKICSSSMSINDKCDHNAFIRIFEIYYLPSTNHLFIFMELLPNKSMHYHLRRRRKIHLNEIIRWSNQLLNAIIFIQNLGIVNRSIRSEHLLMDECFNLKIFNFRYAVSYWSLVAADKNNSQRTQQSQSFAANFIAKKEHKCRRNNHLPPECFHNNYDPKSIDLWSFGVVVCTLITYRYPFKIITRQVIRNMQQCWLDFLDKHRSLFRTTISPFKSIDDDANNNNDELNNVDPNYYENILERIADILTAIFKQNPLKRADVDQVRNMFIMALNSTKQSLK